MAAGTVYSVGQVNAYVARMFSEDYLLRQITVRGEVSNCTYHSSGHIYFTLKDASGTLSCMMYAGKRSGGLSFHMQEGDGVVITGQIRVYERQGKYQLYAEQIIRDGAGLLNERYELLKKKLEEMGMFAEEYKQRIPRYIRRLGIVTAPTGAAVRDIIQIARRRNPYVEIVLYPAIVQGELAPASIIEGIRRMDEAGVDVMIIGRGGGSIEDLWAFNEEAVAQAVFECRTPVISAVGHEVDTVITDYVADLRAPTPSAAAELAVFDWNQFELDCMQLRTDLRGAMQQRIADDREMVKHFRHELENRSPRMRLATQRMAMDQLRLHLQDCMKRSLENSRRELALQESLQRAMKERIAGSRRQLELADDLRRQMNLRLNEARRQLDCKADLPKAMQQKLLAARHELQLLAAGLDKESPVSRLAGGYGYVTDAQGKRVAAAGLQRGELIQVHLKDGKVQAKVQGVELLAEEKTLLRMGSE